MNRSAQYHISLLAIIISVCSGLLAAERHLPYLPPATQRAEVFEFSEAPATRFIGNDKYEITFAVKAACDVTVALIDKKGQIVRHLASGVLGANAPRPFLKNKLKQRIIWNGKNDFDDYVKEPGQLKVRVSLGLRPTFDKLIGWDPQNLVGTYRGLIADANGVYTLSGGNPQLRKYDRNGTYVKTVFPPAAGIPVERFKGMESLEVESGFKTLHYKVGHADFNSTVSGYGVYMPSGACSPHQFALHDGYIMFTNARAKLKQLKLFKMKLSDGTSDDKSFYWRALSRTTGAGLPQGAKGYFNSGEFAGSFPKLTVSPDGKWLYVSGLFAGRHSAPCVYRMDMKTRSHLSKKSVFVGQEKKMGGSNEQFMSPHGIACDKEGRLYVCDTINNRIQIFSKDAKYLKTLKVDRPYLVQVHPQSQELFVIQTTRIDRKAQAVLTKFPAFTKIGNFSKPSVASQFAIGGHIGGRGGSEPLMTVDSWSSPTRVWVTKSADHLLVVEEKGKKFKVVRDFKADAKKLGGRHAPLTNPGFAKVACDAVREQLYFRNTTVYDLKTGKHLHQVGLPKTDDVAFDKRGNMHVHFNPGFYMPGVVRMAPDQSKGTDKGKSYREVPYDYGIIKTGRWNQAWKGVLAVSDQPGGHFFQHGIGVNMIGDICEVACIYYVPKFEDTVKNHFPNFARGTGKASSYEAMIKSVKEQQKRGKSVYSIKRQPGRHLSGSTLFVFDRTGELRSDNIIPSLVHNNGASIDEDGAVYTVFASTLMVNGSAFLSNRSAIIGTGKKTMNPFTGTLIKAPASGAEVFSKRAPIKMEPWPQRPVDVAGGGWGPNSKGLTPWAKGESGGWVENAEWLYAGGSSVIPRSCKCPSQRIYTDWFKRTIMPEGYRKSVGIIDTAGNLIMHLGKYGNADSGRGPDSPVKVGGDEIALAHVMYVAATDHYIALSDMGNERITILKIGYHQEKETGVKTK